MFANWYAELNLFSLATFPPVSAVAGLAPPRYRVAKRLRMPYLYRSLFAKEPYK